MSSGIYGRALKEWAKNASAQLSEKTKYNCVKLMQFAEPFLLVSEDGVWTCIEDTPQNRCAYFRYGYVVTEFRFRPIPFTTIETKRLPEYAEKEDVHEMSSSGGLLPLDIEEDNRNIFQQCKGTRTRKKCHVGNDIKLNSNIRVTANNYIKSNRGTFAKMTIGERSHSKKLMRIANENFAKLRIR